MSDKILDWVRALGLPAAIIILVFYGPWDRVFPDPQPAPEPNVPVVVDDDMEELKAVVSKGDPSDRKKLCDFFCAVSDQFKRIDSAPTDAVVHFIKDAETYRIQGTDLQDAFPGFTAVRNKLLSDAIGTESRTLGKADCEKLSELFADMCQACK